jgi:aminoglycoside phosphotransferase (APT) family kinase protein
VGADAPRAYVDAPITDLSAATAAAELAAAHWGLETPALLRHGMNAIFSSGDVVLRVATPSVPASASIELAEFLLGKGIRVPAPRRGDVVVVGAMSVTAWERITESSTSIDWVGVGALVRRVHAIDARDLPPAVPLPSPAVLPWWDFDSLVVRAGDALDPRARDGLAAVVDRHRGWERFADVVVCHGDVHPGNVMMGAQGPVLLDWDLLCRAPAGWDHGPLMTWHDPWGGDPGIYPAYAAGYGRSFVEDPAAQAFAELRLVAATLMRVIAAASNPAARPEAERRLRYWRNDPDAPAWAAQ